MTYFEARIRLGNAWADFLDAVAEALTTWARKTRRCTTCGRVSYHAPPCHPYG